MDFSDLSVDSRFIREWLTQKYSLSDDQNVILSEAIDLRLSLNGHLDADSQVAEFLGGELHVAYAIIDYFNLDFIVAVGRAEFLKDYFGLDEAQYEQLLGIMRDSLEMTIDEYILLGRDIDPTVAEAYLVSQALVHEYFQEN